MGRVADACKYQHSVPERNFQSFNWKQGRLGRTVWSAAMNILQKLNVFVKNGSGVVLGKWFLVYDLPQVYFCLTQVLYGGEETKYLCFFHFWGKKIPPLVTEPEINSLLPASCLNAWVLCKLLVKRENSRWEQESCCPWPALNMKGSGTDANRTWKSFEPFWGALVILGQVLPMCPFLGHLPQS